MNRRNATRILKRWTAQVCHFGHEVAPVVVYELRESKSLLNREGESGPACQRASDGARQGAYVLNQLSLPPRF
jgi:hypothetical protein